MKKDKYLDISLIVPVFNISSVVEKVLESIKIQTYPIREIIVIDNHSSDNSVDLIKKFIKNNKRMKIKLIERDRTYGISSSYNLGAKLSKSKYIVSLHSDSVLPTRNEIKKLVKPFEKDSKVVASYPFVVHTRNVWLKYNFWQKCLFGTVYGTERPSMNGKFDCYRKTDFLQIGGYDEKKFSPHIGTEDADMHHRLEKRGKVISSRARVVHVHGIDKNYSLKDWIARRKFLSVSYGRYIKMHANDMGLEVLLFFVNPLLVTCALLGFINYLFLVPVLLFPFIYFRKMFFDPAIFLNPRIILLPFILYFLIFYESFWLLESILFKKL